jgi:hypothetical protein
MRSIKSLPAIPVVQSLFVLWGAIWFLFGIVSLGSGLDRAASQSNLAWLLSAVMFANALVMLLLAWGIGRRWRAVFYLSFAVLLVNILLTLTDEFGLFDLIVLIIYLAIAGLLFASRSRYLPAR